MNDTYATEEQSTPGSAMYSRLVLAIYDWWFLGNNCRYLWKCPAENLLDLYNQHVTTNHLDIGVGTGYFLDKCQFPSDQVRLALMDLNTNSLQAASKRLARYQPEVYRVNAAEPFSLNTPAFDSIGMMNLLHCLPGNIKTKATIFEHVKEVMNRGAVIFGSTILYRDVKRNAWATWALKYANKKGFMTNLDDRPEDLRESLQSYFSDSYVKLIGCEALFWARK